MPALPFSAGMKLPDQIYVDSNVAIAFFYKTHTCHTAASTFFLESIAQSKRLLFSALTMDEVWHILMAAWHKDVVKTKFDSAKPAHVALWAPQIESTTNKLLGISGVHLCVANPVERLCKDALNALTTHHLAARDAFHLATASGIGVTAIATTDNGFDALPGMTILKIA